MANLTPAFTSFSAGEVSPLVLARTDVQEVFGRGVKEMVAFRPDPHGPAVRRHGSTFVLELTGDDAVSFTFVLPDGTPYGVVITDNSELHVIDLFGTRAVVATFAAPWPSASLGEIQYGVPPGGKVMYFVHPNVAPQQLTWDGTNWAFSQVTFVSPPSVWSGANWPRAITFFQGRMWLGGTPEQQEQFWGSVSGSYLDFTTGTNDADALDFTMAKQGAIEWMAGVKNLLIGTYNGEHIVTSQGGVITPSDVQVEQQSSFGSKAIQALPVGVKVMYVSPDGRKLREMGYKWTEDAWDSQDITFPSEHITANGRGIKEVLFAQYPNNMILCITDTNEVLCCTYEVQGSAAVIGWATFIANTGQGGSVDGKVLSGSVARTAAGDIPWWVVQRRGGSVFVEIMDDPDLFMDSATIINNSPASDQISVPHLGGLTVTVVVDGAVHPDVTLDGAGDGQLDYPGEVVEVGIGYRSRLTTLPADFGAPTGSAAPYTKAWDRLYVRLIDSALPLINGRRPPDRSASTPMGVREPFETSDVEVSGVGNSLYAPITVEQDLPVPCVVAGIYGELSQSV